MKSRFKDQQIAFALQQAEAGTPVAEVCRKMGVSEPSQSRVPGSGLVHGPRRRPPEAGGLADRV